MKTVECPKCKRVVNIEPEFMGINAGHGRIIDPWRRPSEMQCVCGKHIVAVIASPQFNAA